MSKQITRIRFKLRNLVLGLLFIFTIAIAISITDPIAVGQNSEMEIVAELPAQHPPGNLAITPQGRLIMSQHQFFGAPLRVVEIFEDGSVVAFPNEQWSSPPNSQGIGLNGVLGLQSDKNGVVWMLDSSPGEGQPGKIVAWDTENEELYQVIYLPQPIIKNNSLLNDLAVDLDHNAIYISDTASGGDSALIVVDIYTGFARRVLEGDKSTRPEDMEMIVDDRIIYLGGKPARVGVNPITVDPNNEWVYYAPMSSNSLYRISTEDLLDTSLSAGELSSKVQRYGDKPICDGITVDGEGNVYITSVANYAIGVVDETGQYRTLYQDEKLLSWVNGMAFSDDNEIYVTASQLQNSPPLNNGQNTAQPPFYIVKFPALASGKVGR